MKNKKKRGHAWTFSAKKRKERRKKETTVDNKSLINNHQVSHQEEKGAAVLLMKWWNNRFGYREVSYVLSKRHMRLLWAIMYCPHSYIFFIKKLIIKSKKSKTLSIFFVYINKKTFLKRQNHPWTIASFFFDFKGIKVNA